MVTKVDTGADVVVARSDPDKGPTPDRLLFDFEGFLKGGALDDVFGVPPDSEGGKWEIKKLSGGLVNVTVRVALRRDGAELGRDPRSVVIKYAPPFVAETGEDAPFGTFRQVRYRPPPPPQ